MRKITAIAALLMLAAPFPALAQASQTEETAAEIEQTLRDPAMQEAMAEGMAAASEALLDVPLAPLARAAAEVAGEDPEHVDPDMTLRDVSSEAADVPGRVRDVLPRMMGAMAGMAGGVGAMMPAMRAMVERMREAMANASERARAQTDRPD